MSLDTRLLSGLIALDKQYIRPDDLVAAFRLWRVEPSRSMREILISQGQLTVDRGREIEQTERELKASARGEVPSPNDPSGSYMVARFDQPPASPEPASPEPASPEQASAAQAGGPVRYRPRALHRSGGLGEVYVADDLEVERLVALKQIRENRADDAESRARFLAEARFTGGLEHPGIVPVYGMGQYADGRPFYAMRFIQGVTLREAVQEWHEAGTRDFHSVEFRKLLHRFIDVCQAIGYAHSRNLLHRDIKPNNIMLGDFGETLVVDWGLAKKIGSTGDDTATQQPGAAGTGPELHVAGRAGESGTRSGEVLGTPGYMSPEQAAGRLRELRPTSDVYSLGATLYVIVTGQSPLEGPTVSLSQATSRGRVPSPRNVTSAVPRALEAICMKAMSHKPADRYVSAVELASDVERWLADEPVTARRDPWSQRARRWIRRHQLPVAVAVALLATASLALGVLNVLVSQERDRADAARQLAQSNADMTRDVLDRLFIKIGDDRWSRIPGFATARIEMVTLAVDRYRELARRQPDDDRLRSDLALALRRLANLHRMINRFDQAEPLIREATEMLTALVTENPNETEHYYRLIDGLIDHADLIHRVHGPEAAEPLLIRALEVGRSARTEFPRSVGLKRAHARTCSELAALLAESEQTPRALEFARTATETYQDLLTTPQDRTTRLLASLAWSKYAKIAGADKSVKPQVVRAAIDESVAIARQLVDEEPSDPNGRFVLATALLEQYQWDARQGQSGSSHEEILAEAIRLFEEIRGEQPTTGSFRRRHAEALLVRGDHRLTMGRIDLARADAESALETLKSLMNESLGADSYRGPLADAFILLGKVEHASGNINAARQAWQFALGHLRGANEGQNRASAAQSDVGKLLKALPE